jgi:lysophospholipase L1-like esterase
MALLASLFVNWVLFRKARSFYVQMQEIRLDPVGKKAYANASLDKTQQTTVIAVVGDSRAAAWPIPEHTGGHRFVNRAVGNQTTAQLLGRLTDDVLRLKPDIVLLQAGVNDLKTIPLFPDRRDEIVMACRSNLQNIVSQCAGQSRMVIISTIFPVGRPSLQRKPFWSPDVALSIQEVNSFLRSLSSDNVVILDSHALLCGDDNLIRSEYSTDTLHINAAGYDAANHELTRILKRVEEAAQHSPRVIGVPSQHATY